MSNTESSPSLASSKDCIQAGAPVIEKVTPHTTDVGGILVNRVLPRRQRRTIGAWCFLDHIGPVTGGGVDLHVGAHPHIGLQTFTWMMQGEILHRDSLGTEQLIRPGQVNLMTAGRGIAHTEDTPAGQASLHAAQLWIALPPAHANTTPRFDHYPDLPHWVEGGADFTLLIGEYGGRVAPTLAFSPLISMDIQLLQAGSFDLQLREDFEYGILPLEGSFSIGDEIFAENELSYLGCGRQHLRITCTAPGRALLVGGEPVKEEVLIWWNFVSHSRAEIIQAQSEWESRSARFAPVPGATRRLDPPPIPWKS